MKLLDILKAIRQEEICDEMITTYDEKNKLIHITFLDSVYRGLTVTGDDDEFNVEMYYGMDLFCDFNGVMEVINFCLDTTNYDVFYEKLLGLKAVILREFAEIEDVVFKEDGQNSSISVIYNDEELEISFAYNSFYIYNKNLDDEEYYGYEGPFDEDDILDIIEEYFE